MDSAGPYLLQCPAHAAQRDEMLRGLEGLLPPRIINKCLLVNALIHNQHELSLGSSIKLQNLVCEFTLQSHRFAQVG